jgi:hypothetical protein
MKPKMSSNYPTFNKLQSAIHLRNRNENFYIRRNIPLPYHPQEGFMFNPQKKCTGTSFQRYQPQHSNTQYASLASVPQRKYPLQAEIHTAYNNFRNPTHQYPPVRPLQVQQQPTVPSKRFYNEHRLPPGSALFYQLKNYANNLFSCLLMEEDLKLGTNSSRKTKEYTRILDSLNHTQVHLKNTEIIKDQRHKIESMARNLCMENTKLSLLEYETKKTEILSEINKCQFTRIKYIPAYTKVLNYVLPSMKTRRFYEQIYPAVQKDVQILIQNLCKENGFPLISEKGMHLREQNFSATGTNGAPSNISRKTVTPIPIPPLETPTTNDSHMDLSTTEGKTNRKRTHTANSDISYSPSSSLADISLPTEIEIDHCIKIITNNENRKRYLTNRVKTVEETYTKMKTLTPNNQTLPKLAKVPDTSDIATLNENNTTEEDHHLKETLHKNSFISQPLNSLVTLHGEENPNILSHVCVKISPKTLQDPIILNKLPLETNILYELYLTHESYPIFHDYLLQFIINAEDVNLPFILTIPEEKSNEVIQMLAHVNLQEINHPFRNAPIITSTT